MSCFDSLGLAPQPRQELRSCAELETEELGDELPVLCSLLAPIQITCQMNLLQIVKRCVRVHRSQGNPTRKPPFWGSPY